jgi:predicted DsbA family dithiol-disulfide isomerase
VDTVTRAAESAKESGIEGVPMFIFGGMLAVSGAQSPEYLVAAMERAIAERQKREAEATA